MERLPVLADSRQENAQKINALIKDIQRGPIDGMGKPDPLKGHLAAYGAGVLTKQTESSITSETGQSISYPAKATMRTDNETQASQPEKSWSAEVKKKRKMSLQQLSLKNSNKPVISITHKDNKVK